MPTRKYNKRKKMTIKKTTIKKYKRKMTRGGTKEITMNIYYEPDHSKLYRKGESPDTNYESGDINFSVRNEFTPLDYLKKKVKSVDSLFAKILNKCNDFACLSNNNPAIIAKQHFVIQDDSKR